MAVNLNYLASHSRNLESLLQTYRQIDLTAQSVFLVLGTFLLSRILEAGLFYVSLFFELVLIILSVFSNVVMRKFQKVILSRGEDVNWWHKRIILAEHALPPDERAFTEFKINQSIGVMNDEEIARFLGSDEPITNVLIEKLLDADQNHIRKVINSYIFKVINLMWFIIILLSVGGIMLRWMIIM